VAVEQALLPEAGITLAQAGSVVPTAGSSLRRSEPFTKRPLLATGPSVPTPLGWGAWMMGPDAGGVVAKRCA